MIRGTTALIAHIGYPTHACKASMIYNPYFEQPGVDAVVVPMGCQAGDYPVFLKSVFTLTNIRGALITMPHKVTTVGLLEEATPTVRIAGACNAVRRMQDGPSSCAARSISMSSPAHAVAAGCASSQPCRTRPWWARSSRI